MPGIPVSLIAVQNGHAEEVDTATINKMGICFLNGAGLITSKPLLPPHPRHRPRFYPQRHYHRCFQELLPTNRHSFCISFVIEDLQETSSGHVSGGY